MKYLFSTLFILIFSFASFSQKKALLFYVGCNKGIMVDAGNSNWPNFSKLSSNPDYDLSNSANTLSKYLLNEFFNDFDFEVIKEEELLSNSDYQNFESPDLTGNLSKRIDPISKNVIEDDLIRKGNSWGDPFVYASLTDQDALLGFFPDVDYLIYAGTSTNYRTDKMMDEPVTATKGVTVDASLAIVIQKVSSGKKKYLNRRGSASADDFDFTRYYGEPFDVDASIELHKKASESVIAGLEKGKAKMAEKTNKWLAK